MSSTTAWRPPFAIPEGYDAWLLDCAPVSGCSTCQYNWTEMNILKEEHRITQAARYATRVRDHASGAHR